MDERSPKKSPEISPTDVLSDVLARGLKIFFAENYEHDTISFAESETDSIINIYDKFIDPSIMSDNMSEKMSNNKKTKKTVRIVSTSSPTSPTSSPTTPTSSPISVAKKRTNDNNNDETTDSEYTSESDEEYTEDTDTDTDEQKTSEENDLKIAKERYIKHMDKIVDQIKAIKIGQTITVESDPSYITINKNNIKYCTITKIVRFDTYIFNGYGSKNILRYFMNKTKADPNYGYQKIVQMLDSKNYRRYLPIKNWESFWKAYRDEPIKYRHVFELIRSDQPCKPYLDIEWYTDLDKDARKEDHSAFVEKLQNDLIKVFKDRYKITIDNDDIMIATSHSVKKASFHVVIDKTINNKTLGFRTNRKGFPESAWDLWVALTDLDESYEESLDGAVYTTDREFRLIYSNKTNEFRPVIPYGVKTVKENTAVAMNISVSKCLRYVITHSSSGEYHHIRTPEVPKKYLVVNRRYCDSDMFVPRTYSDKKINYLMQLIRPIHRTAEYTGLSSCGKGWRFSYSDKDEKCYSGNYHESNGFYVFENRESGTIYMKCMSSCCKGIKVLEGTKKNIIMPTKKLF